MPLLPKRCRDGFGLVALVGLLIGGASSPARADRTTRRTPVVEAVERTKQSVVNISSEKPSTSNNRWPFSADETQRFKVSGMGTGVIIDPRGFILTNHHVVDKVNGIEVHLIDGTNLPARVLQADRDMDLAILKVDAGKPLAAIAVGSSADLMLGETVITIGNAFGYENTVSSGIVSFVGRNVTLADNQVYHRLIQVDACINPGNSGGPLINIDGELVGINVATRSGAQGIGFALPIDDVKRVAADMLSTRKLALKWHGLVGAEAWQGEARRVVLTEVPAGSPAEAAGCRPGDQLVRIGDLPVTNVMDVERALLEAQPGQPVPVVVRRGAQDQNLALDIRALNRNGTFAAAPIAPAAEDATGAIYRRLGLKVTPVDARYVVAAEPDLHGGLYVQSVKPDSPGARADIRQGDILVGLSVGPNSWATVSTDNVIYVLSLPELPRFPKIPYLIVRDQKFQRGQMSLADIAKAGGTLSR